MTRDEIQAVLVGHVARIVFTKVDGTLRVMKCTLINDFLPPFAGSNNKRSDEVLPVWDVEKDAWRSFRIDSVESVEVI